MRILLAGVSQFEWFAPAWVQGLRCLGLDVHFFDLGAFFSRGLLGRIEYRFMRGPGVWRTNSELRSAVRRIKPDVLLIYLGFPIYPQTISELTQACWVSGFHHDDPFGAFGNKGYFRLFRQAIPYYSSHHVIRAENIRDYQQLGVKNVKLLRRYYVPWIHYPRPKDGVTGVNSNLDVVFVGHVERDRRIQYVIDILKARVPLRLFGSPEWNRSLPADLRVGLPQSVPLSSDAYARTISAARICLAFHSEANRDRYSYRVFEIPACGGFLLAQRSDVMQGLYEEGEEAEYFDSSEELVDKIRFYLQNDGARERIARQGHHRCVTSEYDVVSCMRQWLADLREFGCR